MQKILSKLLVTRLKNILFKEVSSSQTNFVPGRRLLDGVLVLNELINNKERVEVVHDFES